MHCLAGDTERVSDLLPCPALPASGGNMDLLETVGETAQDHDCPQAHGRVLTLRGDKCLVEIHLLSS